MNHIILMRLIGLGLKLGLGWSGLNGKGYFNLMTKILGLGRVLNPLIVGDVVNLLDGLPLLNRMGIGGLRCWSNLTQVIN